MEDLIVNESVNLFCKFKEISINSLFLVAHYVHRPAACSSITFVNKSPIFL